MALFLLVINHGTYAGRDCILMPGKTQRANSEAYIIFARRWANINPRQWLPNAYHIQHNLNLIQKSSRESCSDTIVH